MSWISIGEIKERLLEEFTINVSKSPNTKKMMEVKSFADLLKFVKQDYMIGCYEDKREIVYFMGPFFFRKVKG